MDYEIYHDESKEHGYWHGILLVPIYSKSLIIDHIKKVRSFLDYQHPLSFKKIKSLNKLFNCAEACLDFSVGSMITKFNPNLPFQIFTGEMIRGRKQYAIYDKLINRNPLGVKFILSCDKEHFEKMYNSLNYACKVEITFGIAVKGGLHYLFSEDNQINVTKIHFDGHRHYRRNINPKRIQSRFKGLREYCHFKDNCPIDDRSSDHRIQNSQLEDDCQLIQLTDLLVGSFRTGFGFLGQGEIKAQRQLSEPVKALIERYQKGYARMRNSRWKNSFCLSASFIEDGKWKYQDIEYAEKQKNKQGNLWD